MLFWGYAFSKAVGDLSHMTTGHWIALVVFLVAVMMTLTFATVKMQGKSAKDKRQEQKRSTAVKLAE
jgi:hypothetical protein